MDHRGFLSFDSEAELTDVRRAIDPAGETVTKELIDVIEYQEDASGLSVTTELVETAREALFASLLEVYTGNDDEFEAWLGKQPALDVHVEGHEHADRRAWHHVGPAETVVAVTFQTEAEAAVGMVRRQAVARYYRELLNRE